MNPRHLQKQHSYNIKDNDKTGVSLTQVEKMKHTADNKTAR